VSAAADPVPILRDHVRSEPPRLGRQLADDLERLFEGLRERGFTVSGDQRAAAFGLVADEVARNGQKLDRLPLRLAPLFAFDAPSQAEVRHLVEFHFAGGPGGVGAEQVSGESGERFRRRRRLWRRGVIALGIVMAAAGVGFVVLDRMGAFEQVVDVPPGSLPREPTSPIADPGEIPLDPRVEFEQIGRAHV